MYLEVRSTADVDHHLSAIRQAAEQTQAWLRAHDGNPMHLLRTMKFEAIGCHPMSGHKLNVIEQINQTFTFAVALAAARELMILHPEANGFRLAPGAHMSLPLDIMSEEEGLVGAETFAAVTPRNNGKLEKDLVKLAERPERHRYVFFASPAFPGTKRLQQFDRPGVQVWSVEV
jgi:hypothetical protein